MDKAFTFLVQSILFSRAYGFCYPLYLQLLLKGASEHGAKRIRVHILTDGRDVLDGTSVGFVETLENDLSKLREKGIDAQIASGGGRMYVTMDRYEVFVKPSTFHDDRLLVVKNILLHQLNKF